METGITVVGWQQRRIKEKNINLDIEDSILVRNWSVNYKSNHGRSSGRILRSWRELRLIIWIKFILALDWSSRPRVGLSCIGLIIYLSIMIKTKNMAKFYYLSYSSIRIIILLTNSRAYSIRIIIRAKS
jgi:hypothetical protein